MLRTFLPNEVRANRGQRSLPILHFQEEGTSGMDGYDRILGQETKEASSDNADRAAVRVTVESLFLHSDTKNAGAGVSGFKNAHTALGKLRRRLFFRPPRGGGEFRLDGRQPLIEPDDLSLEKANPRDGQELFLDISCRA